MRSLAALLLVATVACAKPPRPENMAPAGVAVTRGALVRAIAVGTVTGGAHTNPLTYSRVSADDVREALTRALRARGMLADDPARAAFHLDVGILECGLPSTVYHTEIHAVLRYALRARDGTAVFDSVVEGIGTASVGEVFYGPARLRVANERAIRANLAQALDQLTAADLGPVAASAR